MADEEKASSLLSAEQHDDNQSVEMEFKVADINDEVPLGWRCASIKDVEEYIEQVKLELCGMTFHICSLIDGTIGGPGYGYQITNQTDSSLDHKLLICDPTTTSPSQDILPAMTTNEEMPASTNQYHYDSNITETKVVEHSESNMEVQTTTTVTTEQYSESILTREDKISTETHIMQENSDEILTIETNDSIQPYISSIQNDIENSSNKVEVCVDSSNIEKECEKIELDIIETVIQPSVDVDKEKTVDDVANQSNTSSEDISLAADASLPKNKNAGSGNNSEVSKGDTSNNSAKPANVSDLESGKSTDSSPTVKKKKVKPMSASMQRLTAKKESPESKRSTDLESAAQRKAKADELRKQKIIEQRRKDDERRAAVLERRKKLEDEEREKKEALFKKLTTKDDSPSPSPSKMSPMKKRYSLSTSNLSQLKKTKPLEAKIDLNATTVPKRTTDSKLKDRAKPMDRPKSAMHRPTMGLPPDKNKSQNNDTKRPEGRRPMTAFGTRTSSAAAKPPMKPSSRPLSSSRQSLNTTQPPRPSTALGISNIDKRKVPPKQPRASLTEKPPLSTSKMQKSKSATGLLSRDTKKTAPLSTTEKKTDVKKTTQTIDKKKPMSQTPTKKDVSKDMAEKYKEKPKTTKSSAPPKEKKESTADDRKSSSSSSKSTPKKNETKQMTEEEAKKALAERRKKAKEEAEAKARAEREKDEVERRKREEEEKRLAEQLKLEEERNAALLVQLKEEEEERKQKLLNEKEQREREEKERLEDEQRQREEEIERKAKMELDKIIKEQERQELLLDQERIERKKRVEMIMARVSSKRNTGAEEGTESPTTPPVESSSPPVVSPPELSTDPARLKVNDILRSRGFGRSSEDISTLLDRHEENGGKLDRLDDSSTENLNESAYEPIETDETSPVTDDDVTAENHGIKLLGSVVIDTPVSAEDDSVPLDESPPLTETNETVSRDEAPSAEVSLEKYLNASVKTDEVYSGDNEPCSDSVTTVEYNASDLPTTKSDDVSNYVNHELSDNVDEISLSVDASSIEQVNNHASLNDTNNNKDFVMENSSEPIVAWSETTVPNSQHESNEKVQNHDTESENECLDKLSNQGHIDGPIFMNGSQEGKVVNGSGDLHLVVADESLTKVDDTSNGTDTEQWSKFDERMKQIQPPGDPVPGNEEKFWKVLEGKVELSECF